MKKLLIVISALFISYNSASQENQTKEDNNQYLDNQVYVKIKKAYLKNQLEKSNTKKDFKSLSIIAQNVLEQSLGKKLKVKSMADQAHSNAEQALINTLSDSKKEKIKSFNEKVENIFIVEFSSLSNADLAKLKMQKDVEFVERIPIDKEFEYEIESFSNLAPATSDSLFPIQWSLTKIKAPEAWEEVQGVSDVVVSVVDNSYNRLNNDLTLNTLTGFNIQKQDTSIFIADSLYTHGTSVLGLIASETNNGKLFASASNNMAKVIPIKTCYGDNCYGGIVYGYQGIIKSVQMGAKIINCSWGSGGFSQGNQDIVNSAREAGVLIVAAAGNSGKEENYYPASYNNVVSVAMSVSSDQLKGTSTYSSTVDLTAPGGGVYVGYKVDGYSITSGTSFASPITVACMSYFLSAFPNTQIDSVEFIFKKTADDITEQNLDKVGKFGAGRINLLNAVSCKKENMIDFDPFMPNIETICEGDTFKLNPVNTYGVISELYLNNILIDQGKASYNLTKEGAYYLKYKKGNCELKSYTKSLIYNQTFSEQPLTTNLELQYSQSTHTIVAQPPFTPTPIKTEQKVISKSYTGETIRYDNFASSGPNPKINFSNINFDLEDIEVTVVWEKKDIQSSDSCSKTDMGGKPYYGELGIKLKRPDGSLIDLILCSSLYNYSTNIGTITTVFNQNFLNPVELNEMPSSGNFKPVQDIIDYDHKRVNGDWELIGIDNGQGDPLCINGFSMKIKYQEISGTGNVSLKWFDEFNPDSLLSSDSLLTIPVLPVGEYHFYAQLIEENKCPSPKTVSTVKINPVGEIVSLKKSDLSLSLLQENNLNSGHNFSIETDSSTHTMTLFGLDSSNQSFAIDLTNVACNKTGLVLCDTSDLIMLTLDCPSSVQWNNYEGNHSTKLDNIFSNFTVTSTCIDSATNFIYAQSNFNINVLEDATPKVFSGNIPPYSDLSISGSTISTTQKVGDDSHLSYVVSHSLELNPGFEVSGQSVLLIVPKTCID